MPGRNVYQDTFQRERAVPVAGRCQGGLCGRLPCYKRLRVRRPVLRHVEKLEHVGEVRPQDRRVRRLRQYLLRTVFLAVCRRPPRRRPCCRPAAAAAASAAATAAVTAAATTYTAAATTYTAAATTYTAAATIYTAAATTYTAAATTYTAATTDALVGCRLHHRRHGHCFLGGSKLRRFQWPLHGKHLNAVLSLRRSQHNRQKRFGGLAKHLVRLQQSDH